MFEQKDLRTLLADSATPVKHKQKQKHKKKKKKKNHHPAAKKRTTEEANLSAAKKTHAKRKHQGPSTRPSTRPDHNAGVQGRYAVRFCGAGNLTTCRAALLVIAGRGAGDSARPGLRGPDDLQLGLRLHGPAGVLRRDPLPGAGPGDRGLVPWQNRPTQQQAVEIPSQLPR